MEAEAHGHGGHGHDDPKAHEKHYWKIYWILVVLLLISVAGPFLGAAIDWFAITLFTAFGIAVIKAALVVKNFMHLTMEPKFVAYVCATALTLMGLLFFWVAPDIMKHEGHNWVNVSAQAAALEQEAVHTGSFDPEEVFQGTCSSCHGMDGKGDGPAAAGLDPKPANFTDPDFWAQRDRERIKKVIREGGASVGKSPVMAAFGASYTDEQLEALVDYLQGQFRPDEPAEEPLVEVEAGQQPAEGEQPAAEGEQPAAEGEQPAAEGQQPAEGEQVAEGGQPAEGEAAPAPAPPEPTGPSEAEKAAYADFITGRLYR